MKHDVVDHGLDNLMVEINEISKEIDELIKEIEERSREIDELLANCKG